MGNTISSRPPSTSQRITGNVGNREHQQIVNQTRLNYFNAETIGTQQQDSTPIIGALEAESVSESQRAQNIGREIAYNMTDIRCTRNSVSQMYIITFVYTKLCEQKSKYPRVFDILIRPSNTDQSIIGLLTYEIISIFNRINDYCSVTDPSSSKASEMLGTLALLKTLIEKEKTDQLLPQINRLDLNLLQQLLDNKVNKLPTLEQEFHQTRDSNIHEFLETRLKIKVDKSYDWFIFIKNRPITRELLGPQIKQILIDGIKIMAGNDGTIAPTDSTETLIKKYEYSYNKFRNELNTIINDINQLQSMPTLESLVTLKKMLFEKVDILIQISRDIDNDTSGALLRTVIFIRLNIDDLKNSNTDMKTELTNFKKYKQELLENRNAITTKYKTKYHSEMYRQEFIAINQLLFTLINQMCMCMVLDDHNTLEDNINYRQELCDNREIIKEIVYKDDIVLKRINTLLNRFIKDINICIIKKIYNSSEIAQNDLDEYQKQFNINQGIFSKLDTALLDYGTNNNNELNILSNFKINDLYNINKIRSIIEGCNNNSLILFNDAAIYKQTLNKFLDSILKYKPDDKTLNYHKQIIEGWLNKLELIMQDRGKAVFETGIDVNINYINLMSKESLEIACNWISITNLLKVTSHTELNENQRSIITTNINNRLKEVNKVLYNSKNILFLLPSKDNSNPIELLKEYISLINQGIDHRSENQQLIIESLENLLSSKQILLSIEEFISIDNLSISIQHANTYLMAAEKLIDIIDCIIKNNINHELNMQLLNLKTALGNCKNSDINEIITNKHQQLKEEISNPTPENISEFLRILQKYKQYYTLDEIEKFINYDINVFGVSSHPEISTICKELQKYCTETKEEFSKLLLEYKNLIQENFLAIDNNKWTEILQRLIDTRQFAQKEPDTIYFQLSTAQNELSSHLSILRNDTLNAITEVIDRKIIEIKNNIEKPNLSLAEIHNYLTDLQKTSDIINKIRRRGDDIVNKKLDEIATEVDKNVEKDAEKNKNFNEVIIKLSNNIESIIENLDNNNLKVNCMQLSKHTQLIINGGDNEKKQFTQTLELLDLYINRGWFSLKELENFTNDIDKYVTLQEKDTHLINKVKEFMASQLEQFDNHLIECKRNGKLDSEISTLLEQKHKLSGKQLEIVLNHSKFIMEQLKPTIL